MVSFKNLSKSAHLCLGLEKRQWIGCWEWLPTSLSLLSLPFLLWITLIGSSSASSFRLRSHGRPSLLLWLVSLLLPKWRRPKFPFYWTSKYVHVWFFKACDFVSVSWFAKPIWVFLTFLRWKTVSIFLKLELLREWRFWCSPHFNGRWTLSLHFHLSITSQGGLG